MITLYRQVFAQCHHGAVLLGCPGHAWATTNSFFEQEQMMTGSVVKMATLAAAAACVLAVATPAQAQDTKIVDRITVDRVDVTLEYVVSRCKFV